MPNSLKEFWQDQQLVELVRQHLLNHLDQLALERVYRKGDTLGIADAKEAIDNAFMALDDAYQKEKFKEPINLAR